MCGKVLREEDHYNIIVAVAQKKMVGQTGKNCRAGHRFCPVRYSDQKNVRQGALLPTQIFLLVDGCDSSPLLLPMLLRVEYPPLSL